MDSDNFPSLKIWIRFFASVLSTPFKTLIAFVSADRLWRLHRAWAVADGLVVGRGYLWLASYYPEIYQLEKHLRWLFIARQTKYAPLNILTDDLRLSGSESISEVLALLVWLCTVCGTIGPWIVGANVVKCDVLMLS